VNYEAETRAAYQNAQRAASYKHHQTREWSWARLTTWCEHRAVAKALSYYRWTDRDFFLDAPCGTGVLAPVMRRFPFRVVAADIALEMMALARDDYRQATFLGFVRSDLTRLPVKRNGCAGAVVLGFMHRAPAPIRQKVLSELASTVSRVLVISYSEDDLWQRCKRRVLGLLQRGYAPAPCAISPVEAAKELHDAGFTIRRRFRVVPLLSSAVVLVVEKRDAA
jgi:SAM-dependent methyltransferase